MMKTLILPIAVIGLTLSGTAESAVTSNFDNLILAANSHWAGETSPSAPLFEPNASSFNSGLATFSNQMTDWGGGVSSWSGWAYSNQTDNTTPGFENQYSAYTGQAHSGSNFGIAYLSGDAAQISFAGPVQADGLYLTNTTYTALSMLNGDSFAKKFGGASGNDADWLKLTVSGLSGGVESGAIDFYLADYRSSNNSLDYIVNGWEWLNLSSLGTIDGLKFAISSSDTGQFGMNTPAYFAMDDLTVTAVPLPATIWLMITGLLAFLGFNRGTVHRNPALI